MKANYGEKEIQALLVKVRIFNTKIGTYEVFAITDSFDYVVKVSNGKILLKIEELQDDEKEALSREKLEAIAARFVSSDAQTTDSKQQIVNENNKQEYVPKKISKASVVILILLIIIIVAFAVFNIVKIINNNNSSSSDSRYDKESYEEKVMTVEEMERANPTDFLSATGTYRFTLIGNYIKIKCEISNNATVASYKDAVVRVRYYSKTDAEITTNDYTIYEVFPPTSTKTVELKVESYNNVSSIGWDVIRAKAN